MSDGTLFDTSIYTFHPSQPIADYGVDVDYDPLCVAQFERRKRDCVFKGATDVSSADEEKICNESGSKKFLEDKPTSEISSRKMGESQFLEEKNESEEISSLEVATEQFLEEKNELEEISSLVKRRNKGQGSGCIYYRTVTKKGKDYREAYYQYEIWQSGRWLVKSSKYIPKRLLKQIEQMEAEKVPVSEILDVLGVIYW